MNPKNPTNVASGDLCVFEKGVRDYDTWSNHHKDCADKPHKLKLVYEGNSFHQFYLADIDDDCCSSTICQKTGCRMWYSNAFRLVTQEPTEEMLPDPFFMKKP